MKPRCIAAVLFTALAFGLLLTRVYPAFARYAELGDPLDQVIIAGSAPLIRDDAALARRIAQPTTLHVWHADRRGSATFHLRLRVEPAPALLRLDLDARTVIVATTPVYRTYHLLGGEQPRRESRIRVQPADGSAILVDRLAASGRAGLPPWLDLLHLLALASAPALLLLLTQRLAIDWSLLIAGLALPGLALLPRVDLPALLRLSPLIAATLIAALLVRGARAAPGAAVLMLMALALRWYGLGWGSGYVFHPDEQALLRDSLGLLSPLARLTGRAAAVLSGHPVWLDAWGIVLLGRCWSALFSSMTVGLTYAVGRQLLRPRWALLAAAFVAVAPIGVQQAHQAGPGSLYALTLTLALLGACRALHAEGRIPWRALGLTLPAVALLPFGWTLTLGPCVGVLVRRRPEARPMRAVFAAALLLVALAIGLASLGSHAGAAPSRAVQERAALSIDSSLPYIYPLFGVIFWGVGPLLMQLGVVGWGAGLVLTLSNRRERHWLPVLLALGGFFLVVARDPAADARVLGALVPGLSLAAALLLQSFALRLPLRGGQRAVRLLAHTALALALVNSLGLLAIYRAPDARIVAARWLAQHGADDPILIAGSAADALPLRVTFPNARLLPPWSESAALARALAEARHLVVIEGSLNDWPACAQTALRAGRLGLRQQRLIAPLPRLGPWTLDDSAADPALRLHDHPQIRIYRRASQPAPDAVRQLLTCAAP